MATETTPGGGRRGTEGGGPLSAEARALEEELRAKIRGEVRFDRGSRALYATDSSNYRQVPIGVVIPRDAEDVVQTVALCRRHGAPVLPRGGGTSLAGQCCNIAVVIDMSKYMNRVLEIDPRRKIARVQPGLILDELRETAERHHLTYGPDPATHTHCTLGGMIGNNSCGVHSIMAGMTSENVEELEVLTYDGLRMRVGRTSEEELESIVAGGGRRGEIYGKLRELRDRYAGLIRERFPQLPRRVSGYNLVELLPENGFHVGRALVGTEGTCVTVLEATTRLVYSPPARSLLVLGYPSAYEAADHVMEIMAHRPVGLEGFDDVMVDSQKHRGLNLDKIPLLPEGGGWLLVEFGADEKKDADEAARRLMEDLRGRANAPNMKLLSDPKEAAKVWAVREAGLAAAAKLPDGAEYHEGWEDAGIPPERLGGYLRDLKSLLDRYGYRTALYGHFGQGCVHMRMNFDLESEQGVKDFRSFMCDAANLAVGYGGSLSGEHGDGQSRGELLPIMFGEELVQGFREFKAIWDPENRMNPGKVVNPYRLDQNLRLGTDYHPRPVRTSFKFPDDHNSFARATLRCVGVGKCRRAKIGTMCPSFMVTREEMHSTRGRARLLFEMLEGDPLKGGWKDEQVKEALDLCLACKGCKGDCPVNVDMATYKAEFLSHYYEGRLRPPAAYAFGMINYWARLASIAPGVANFFIQAPLLRDVAKAAAGIAPERRIPAFAPQTFKSWFAERGSRNEGGPRVILWGDTFNNHFKPETARAAVEVLEAAGFQVVVPRQPLCCGRPLYDYGMLGLAKRLLRQVMDALGPEIEAGTPVVGLEPSCAAVFRDELVNLFPDDPKAAKLSRQTYLLSEFLQEKAPDFRLPALHRKAVVHGHCHHKAVMTMGSEEWVLAGLGLEYQLLDSGCCGMAGAFGFEKQHYDISMAVGERVLLPAVRAADRETLIVADGFSCREQISQATDREALHLAQVMQMALREGPEGPKGGYPESGYVGPPEGEVVEQKGPLVVASLLTALAIMAMARRLGRRR